MLAMWETTKLLICSSMKM
uniref:Uncharacterized protein n=1 Tax=Anguilla anguilla TaxID=7936 RepID=A0A0E9VBX6_ANGAN